MIGPADKPEASRAEGRRTDAAVIRGNDGPAFDSQRNLAPSYRAPQDSTAVRRDTERRPASRHVRVECPLFSDQAASA